MTVDEVRCVDEGAEPASARPELAALAGAAGVLTAFRDHAGELRTASERALVGVLAALGHDASTERSARRARERLEEWRAARVLPPVRVLARDDLGEPFLARAPRGWRGVGTVRARLVREDGAGSEAEDARVFGEGETIELPYLGPLGIGRHRLEVELVCEGRTAAAAQTLIVHPGAAPSPWGVVGPRGAFGLIANLYGVRSTRRHAAGDLTDLATLARWAGAIGASFVGVNPLHALAPGAASPYQPLSRRFRHAAYLDLAAVPEFAECPAARAWLDSPPARAERERLADADLLEPAAVHALQEPALAALFRAFERLHRQPRTERGRAFERFAAERGDALERFATFCALREHVVALGGEADWRRWPAAYRDPRSSAVREFRAREREGVERAMWVQFELDRQLEAAALAGRDAGLAVGLYTDLAVGTPPWSADAWADQDVFALGVSLGAPPDALATEGQDWGLAPFHPERLAERAYAPFAALLADNLRHAGALRLDHVLGLFRQFWVPDGHAPTDGAYVRFPADDLLGIVALEAARARALVVGEDLGTVPEEVPDALRRYGLLASKVLVFERDVDGAPREARDFEPEALVTANTHDLATLAGHAACRDLERRLELGQIDEEDAIRARRERRAELRALGALVNASAHASGSAAWRGAVHTHLASTPSALFGVALDDLVGELDAVNLPGVGDDRFPCWRRRMSLTVEELATDPDVERALGRVAELRPRHAPRASEWRATYRLQLGEGLTLFDVARRVPYLARLGVSHLYLSPVLVARAGSTHGYDVVDPSRVDGRVGGERGWRACVAAARAHGLGVLVDVVPNHAGIGADDPMWIDALARGADSPWWPWFDLLPESGERLPVPLLGDEPDTLIARGEARVEVERGRASLSIGGQRFPLAPPTVGFALEARRDPALLGELLARQPYRLAHWREAAERVPWRRFFDVTELIALRAEDERVFAASHARILEQAAAGEIDGVRIDHVDGLRDPAAYLARLRAALDAVTPAGRAPIGIWVEKILAGDERLVESWPIEGTTGYEFAVDADALFVEPDGARRLAAASEALDGSRDFAEALARAKGEVLATTLRADVRRLARALERVACAVEPRRAPDARACERAVTALLVALPVYRTYARSGEALSADDAERIAVARAEALAVVADGDRDAVELASGLLAGTREVDGDARAIADDFVARFQQLGGATMAKGGEDTALYRHAPLLSLAEVGGEPDRDLDIALARFHARCGERAARHPRNLLAVTTHDTKRSADLRARLDVLTSVPGRWIEARDAWLARHAPRASGGPLPDAGTCHVLLQALVGIWPDVDGRVPPPTTLAELADRLAAFARKAAREAKVHTRWTAPDEAYERRLEDLARGLLDAERSAAFLDDVSRFVAWIGPAGMWVSLARSVLQFTTPGVPDVYQGDELPFLALVDPDNRRPVDFDALEARLTALELAERTPLRQSCLRSLRAHPTDSALELHVVHRLLQARAEHPEAFAARDYTALPTRGPLADELVAFARVAPGGHALLTVVPRRFRPPRDPAAAGGERIERADWRGTYVELPRALAHAIFASPLTGERWCADGAREVPVAQLFDTLPLAVLVARGAV